jgi:hypothetical protein
MEVLSKDNLLFVCEHNLLIVGTHIEVPIFMMLVGIREMYCGRLYLINDTYREYTEVYNLGLEHILLLT